MEINKKRIIVTGAASGVGKELTKELINKGAFVYGLDINSNSLEELKKELNSSNLETFTVDISKKESLEKFKKDLGDTKIDILINNAGIIQPFVHIKDLDDNTIDRVMNVNFYGPMNLTRLFLNDLIDNPNGAYIVNVSSMGGFFPFPGQSIYGASKAALKIFTEGLYAELSNTKVKVMVVFPGAMDTNITKNSNVTTSASTSSSNIKMLSASTAAKEIITGIEKNKFKLFLGSDAKFMKTMYKLNSKKAIDLINKKMQNL